MNHFEPLDSEVFLNHFVFSKATISGEISYSVPLKKTRAPWKTSLEMFKGISKELSTFVFVYIYTQHHMVKHSK